MRSALASRFLGARKNRAPSNGDPQWYKDAIIYELHVRAFYDSDGDGIGDFRGLTEKLDYFADLGITALWLLPFYPSPLRDDGYDIADYRAVNPAYGTLDDFKMFLDEAHTRGLRVITELVLNHTSSEHPWFQRARRAAPDSSERNFYVWNDTADKYTDARIIFKDFETSNWTWDPLARAYYWHRFYSHQPDLNFDNPAVHAALLEAVDFWLGLGVDGLRLDAVPYLFEREGTNCENLPETHEFLRRLRAHVDAKYQDRMLLAEANQWPEDAVAYFGNGDECHMAFHFPVMPRMFMALQLEDRFPIIDILEQTPSIPNSCQWALFLRNHDELTLEMVTDEDRDYMYRVYANDPQARINLGIRRRLAPLLGERRKIELLSGLLFSLPGTPVLYYADEIGMGDNIYLGDRNGVRTPMQWSADRNAGFSRANPQKLYLPVIIDPEFHFESVNVEAQQNNSNSLLWWTKRLMGLRKRFRAFGRGSFELVVADNRKVLSFIRRLGDEVILVVANLSRFAQPVRLQLPDLEGQVPLELFGHTEFPAVGSDAYFLTLGPHGFYWFSLRPQAVEAVREPVPEEEHLPQLEVDESWLGVLDGQARVSLQDLLPGYIRSRRWFRGKARAIKEVTISDIVEPRGGNDAVILLLQVDYHEHEAETYVLPLGFATGDGARRLLADVPHAVVARLSVVGDEENVEEGVLCDAVFLPAFDKLLLSALVEEGKLTSRLGAVHFFRVGELPVTEDLVPELEPRIGNAEQTNTSIVYGDAIIFKLLRRVEAGISPELEMGRFLTERAHFANASPLVGGASYATKRGSAVTVAVAHAFVANEGDAWSYTIDGLSRYYTWAAARQYEAEEVRLPPAGAVPLFPEEPPSLAAEGLGEFLASAQLLGQRTGELHLALASDLEDPAFAPEPFTSHYQRSLYELVRTRSQRALQLLRTHLHGVPDQLRDSAKRVLADEKRFGERIKKLLSQRITSLRIRCHGDYHLGQVLFTGNDFIIIDFEGEPGRYLAERRFKRSALTDVAGMLRSFHYASVYALRHKGVREEDITALMPWAEAWRRWVTSAFLRSYLATVDGAPFIPRGREELRLLLEIYIIEKAFYEVAYELNNRPEWLDIPLTGLLQLLTDED